ncbi:MAG TPA: hypothetical protein VMU12_02020 [Candidatus Paceibacterota bacterium]|nr:hypothetical protein [Candidatus Paceibacterota bacterium]
MWSVPVIVILLLAIVLVQLLRASRQPELTLEVHIKDSYCDVTSPQLPGASSIGQGDTAAIGSFIKIHGAKLGINVVCK